MTFLGARLKIVFDTGELNDNNKAIMVSKSYSDVKDGATQEKLLEVVNAIAGLSSYNMQQAELITTQFIC